MKNEPLLNQSSLIDLIAEAINDSSQGVVGLVDQLLSLCGRADAGLDCTADVLQLTNLDGTVDSTPNTLPRSVFRAALSRIAALCGAETDAEISPYGGTGKISANATSDREFLVEFENTPEHQRLQLITTQPVSTEGKDAHE